MFKITELKTEFVQIVIRTLFHTPQTLKVEVKLRLQISYIIIEEKRSQNYIYRQVYNYRIRPELFGDVHPINGRDSVLPESSEATKEASSSKKKFAKINLRLAN